MTLTDDWFRAASSGFLVQRIKLLTPSVVQSTDVQGLTNYNDRFATGIFVS